MSDYEIVMTDEETGEEVSLYVINETELSGAHYLLVTDQDPASQSSEDEDMEEDDEYSCMILKEISGDNDDAVYEAVTDDDELDALGKVFSELLSDTEVELKIE